MNYRIARWLEIEEILRVLQEQNWVLEKHTAIDQPDAPLRVVLELRHDKTSPHDIL